MRTDEIIKSKRWIDMKQRKYSIIVLMVSVCVCIIAMPLTALTDLSNLCPDGKFQTNEIITSNENYSDSGLDYYKKWHLVVSKTDGADAEPLIENGQCHIIIKSGGKQPSNIQLLMMPVSMSSGLNYRLSFDARSSKGRSISAELKKAGKDPVIYRSDSFSVGTEMKKYSMEFMMSSKCDHSAVMSFDLGKDTGDVWLSNVKFEMIDD
jgi:ribosomal protein L25 (general stress protein Ctc)